MKKYVRPSTAIPSVMETYVLQNYTVDHMHRRIGGTIAHYDVESGTGAIMVSYLDFSLMDIAEYIIDPAWSETSTPPKPIGFDPVNPITWGTLSWDEIPKVLNPAKLTFSQFLARFENDEPIETVIYSVLSGCGTLPSDPEFQII